MPWSRQNLPASRCDFYTGYNESCSRWKIKSSYIAQVDGLGITLANQPGLQF
jgi:hypothetical protein